MRITKYLNRFRQHLRRGLPQQQREMFRSRPTLEALEDRMLLSAATQIGSTLNITMDPGTPSAVQTLVMEVDSTDHTKMDVIENGILLGKFTIASITNVNVTVAGNDAVKVNDSNGIPFANGCSISLTGAGPNNSLNLVGNKPLNFNGNEIYFAGTSIAPSALSLGIGAPVFSFNKAISSVTDDLPATQLILMARGQAVSQIGSNGLTQTLKGLAGPGGGGSTFTFRDKTSVILQLITDTSTATLNAAAGAIGEQFFRVEVSSKNDTVNINTTPSNVTTSVSVSFGPDAVVNLRGNSGQVRINGDGTTVVRLGSSTTLSSVTSAIKGNVFVEAAAGLIIFDPGNATTQELVRVTETTVSGSGLFGNNAVTVTYEDTTLDIFTGQLINSYTVAASQPGATFASKVEIFDEHQTAAEDAGLFVHVVVDSGSALRLFVVDANPATGSLDISAVNGTFNPTPPTPQNGTERVNFTSGFQSEINYNGFDRIFLSP
jgi:hypothetical protein